MVVPVTPLELPVRTAVMETLLSCKMFPCFFLFADPIILTLAWWLAQTDSSYNPKMKYGMNYPKDFPETGQTP